MATTTNFGWTTPDDTSLVKDGASAIRTLGSSVDTSMAQLKGGTTGQLLSKTSNTDMAFTWVAPPQGMTLISTTTFSSTSTTVSSIPGTYKHLYIVYAELYGNTDNNWLVLRPNNLSTSIYTYHNFSAFNSSTSIDSSATGTYVPVGHMTSSTTGRNKASGAIWIPNYTSTDAIKFVTSSSRVVTSTGNRAGLYQGTLDLNSAITSLVFTGDSATTFTNGKIYLYGVN